MFVHDVTKKVRYGETDQMGFMYYGNYCLLYEIGRAEAVRSLGLTYRDLEKVHKIMMPVLHVESRYLRPAHYDETITIRTIVREPMTKLAIFHHEIYNEKEELLHKGVVKLFFVDMITNKRISCPEIIATRLSTHFEK